jgi:GNAT superfamily N-acetyltransferase
MTLRYREFKNDEAEEIGKLFAATFNSLLVRLGLSPYVDLSDEAAWSVAWERDRRSLFEHLTTTGSASWLVENAERRLGYARSIIRGDVCQLTDFFVHPEAQRGGLGKELLERAFGSLKVRHRIVISSPSGAAVASYLKAGLSPRGSIYDFHRAPVPNEIETDLQFKPMSVGASVFSLLNRIDHEILGFEREIDHRWLLGDRRGFQYLRQGEPVGYGYVGRWSGPFALRDSQDYPAVLAHAETTISSKERDFGLMIPLANRPAVDHALRRGFRMGGEFPMLFMSDDVNPDLDRYIFSMPGFFL